MSSPVTQIKERLSIEEVVSTYIKIERSGVNFKARCPFHNEKTPSFFISPGRSSYYCFGCSASGDIFTFVEEFEGLDFKGALKLLANKAGVVLSDFNPEKESEKEVLYRIMEDATNFFVGNLSQNTLVINYLKQRGLEEKSIADFRIGFIKNEWRDLYQFLVKKGYKDIEIEKAGLAKKTEKGMYDRFRGRIIFPIADSSGRIIAFSGRIFEDDGKSAKYLNSPETPIFNKSSVLYGLDRAKDSIRKNNFSILVEGQMDLVLSHQAGFKNTVATSGTALSESIVSKENVVSNLGLLRRLSENIVLAFDADKAGINASERAGKIALSLSMDVKVANIKEGMDPADLISKEGVEAWREAIRGSKHIIEFLLNRIIKKTNNDTRLVGREVKEKLLPFVNFIDSAIEKAHFIKMISDTAGIAESALLQDLKKVNEDLKVEKEEIEIAKNVNTKLFRQDYIERKLFGIIFWQQKQSLPIIDTKRILLDLGELLNKTEDEILNKFKDRGEDLIYEAEVFYGGGENLERDVIELLSNFKEEYLKEQLARKMMELHLAEKEKDSDKSNKILNECQIISNKIEELKNGRIK
ncbi:MAG: DNA primase [Candidatus Pacebacteria bacterium]|nr:DNA primase [Candidatus Paceibacterota bacterium]